ncbi:hypothetical protein MTO96_050523 [Rhipicephalus appendiculatus]
MDEANPDWAPSLNLGYKSTTHAKRSASDRYERLKQRRRASAPNVLQLKQREESPSTNAAPVAARTATEEICDAAEEPSCLPCPVLQDNGAVQCHLQVDLQNNQATAFMTDKEVTTDLLSAHISAMEEENRRLHRDLASAHSRLAMAVPDRDALRSNPDMVQFYTGLPNYAVLEAVYSLVEPHTFVRGTKIINMVHLQA